MSLMRGVMMAEMDNMGNDIQVLNAKIRELRYARKVEAKTIADLRAKNKELDSEVDQWRMHYSGMKAERDYLLDLLDEKCGGAENNPARQDAYAEEHYANGQNRIPKGDREGDRITRRDHFHIREFRAAKDRYFGEGVGGSWVEWINTKIFGK